MHASTHLMEMVLMMMHLQAWCVHQIIGGLWDVMSIPGHSTTWNSFQLIAWPEKCQHGVCSIQPNPPRDERKLPEVVPPACCNWVDCSRGWLFFILLLSLTYMPLIFDNMIEISKFMEPNKCTHKKKSWKNLFKCFLWFFIMWCS